MSTLITATIQILTTPNSFKMLSLHIGQVLCSTNHGSIHSLWNSCLQRYMSSQSYKPYTIKVVKIYSLKLLEEQESGQKGSVSITIRYIGSNSEKGRKMYWNLFSNIRLRSKKYCNFRLSHDHVFRCLIVNTVF